MPGRIVNGSMSNLDYVNGRYGVGAYAGMPVRVKATGDIGAITGAIGMWVVVKLPDVDQKDVYHPADLEYLNENETQTPKENKKGNNRRRHRAGSRR